MAAEHELSAPARQRMAALLPDLLDAVRARRHRRYARRAAIAALVVALPVVAWQLATGGAGGEQAMPAIAAPAFAVVHDDPTVFARCVVATEVRAEWLLTDDGLQAELRAAERPAGLVRTNDRVLVSAAAISKWPGELP